jgi:hypothetical protein
MLVEGNFELTCRTKKHEKIKFGVFDFILILRNSENFIDPEHYLPYSQVLVTYLYPEPELFSPCVPARFFKIHYNIILPFTHRSSKWSLSSVFHTKDFNTFSIHSHYFHMSHPSSS